MDIFELAVDDGPLADHILKIRGDVGHLDVDAVPGVILVEEDFCEDVVVAFGCFQLDYRFWINIFLRLVWTRSFFSLLYCSFLANIISTSLKSLKGLLRYLKTLSL